jgi:ABC-type multidrug transport system ATPase subunit
VRVEAERVRKRFGRVVALDDVSFAIAPGQRVALVGPNGSGKSTLNRVLMGLVACEGSVRVDGRSPFRDRVAVARRLAYVPQAAPQLAAPVAEVVGAIARVRGIDPAAVARVGDVLGLDVPALAARPFRSLSGGTKQKLLIALAFASGASLLILDEPTGSLDAAGRERFFELFASLGPGATLVLCSHRLEEIRPLVDHVLLLDEGRIAWDGPAAGFLERCTRATIEAWVEGEDAARWLADRGFRRTPSGAWRRTLDPSDKRKLAAELVRELGGALRDLNLRDLESVELGKGSRP